VFHENLKNKQQTNVPLQIYVVLLCTVVVANVKIIAHLCVSLFVLLMHIHCVATGSKTDKWMGVSEMLLCTSICGVLFALLSAQPLVIIGATGPIIVFEEALFKVNHY